MPRRFPNRPRSQLSAKFGAQRSGSRLQRLILGEQLIISRALCHFETMPALPSGQSMRAYEAAKLSAKARTPISNADFYFSWGTDQIGVWSWSKSLTEDLADFEGVVLPETALHMPFQTGARLVTAIDGFEGQVWRNSQLIASRWWANRPGVRDWSAFLRAARISEPSEDAPTPVDPHFLNRPSAPQPYTALLDRLRSIHLRDIAALTLVCLAAPCLYLFGQWAQLSQAQASATAELAKLSEETAEISAARQNAQRASNELAAYAATLNRRHPTALLASVSEELARFSIRLDAFEQTEEELTLVMHASNDFNPESLVRAMENNPLMNTVSLEPGRGPGEWVLNSQLEVAG